MLSKRLNSRRIFKGYGECVIASLFWDGMMTIETFGEKGYDKRRERRSDFDAWGVH